MRVLVTGASGFVGREIVCELKTRGFDVIQMFGETKRLAAGEIFSADVADAKSFAEIEKIEPVDAVIHAAGLAHQFDETKREKFWAVNVRGTKNVAGLAVKLKAWQFILIGSTAVYGAEKAAGEKREKISEIETDENAECRPQTIYAESKLAAEEAAREVCEANSVAMTILRFAPVLGEDGAGNAARLIEAIDKGRFVWVGGGENLKSLVYKRDIARLCAEILPRQNRATEIFNLAAEPIKMLDFVETIALNLNRRVLRLKIPTVLFEWIFRLNRKTIGAKKIERAARTFEKWLSDDVYAASKIALSYGFEPQTSVREALERQVAAYLERRNKK